MKSITVNTNEEFRSLDGDVQGKFQTITEENFGKLGFEIEWEDIGGYESFRCDVSEDEEFWIEGIIERAWGEAHA